MSLNWISLTIAIAVGINHVAQCSTAATFSESVELSPIRSTYSSVYKTVSRVRTLVAQANSGDSAKYESETLLLVRGGSKLELPKGFQEDALDRAPEVANSIWYEYKNIKDGASISEVEIRLGDGSRTVTVEGSSKEQVDALIGIIDDDFHKMRGIFGGADQRYIVGVFLYIIIIIILVIGWGFLMYGGPNEDLGFVFFVFAIALFLMIFAINWEKWFPGTAIFAGEPSILTRYSHIISLLGLIVTIVPIVSAIIYRSYKYFKYDL